MSGLSVCEETAVLSRCGVTDADTRATPAAHASQAAAIGSSCSRRATSGSRGSSARYRRGAAGRGGGGSGSCLLPQSAQRARYFFGRWITTAAIDHFDARLARTEAQQHRLRCYWTPDIEVGSLPGAHQSEIVIKDVLPSVDAPVRRRNLYDARRRHWAVPTNVRCEMRVSTCRQ